MADNNPYITNAEELHRVDQIIEQAGFIDGSLLDRVKAMAEGVANPTGEHLFYFVAMQRGDGAMPNIGKAYCSLMFDYDDAVEQRDQLNKEFVTPDSDSSFAVFACETINTRLVTEEVG